MKNISWDQSLSVEVDEIDEDHRRLVDLFNLLSHAVAEGESDDYIDALLEELIACTVWHFRHEERLMVRHGYNGLIPHRAEHNELIDSVRDLQRTFHAADKTLSNDDIEYLADWLTGHIMGQDMRLGFFLMEVM